MLLELALIIIVATLLAFAFRYFKQEFIPAYILTGILVGPVLAWILSNTEYLSLLPDFEFVRAAKELGIAFLLFIVGLEVNIKKLKDVKSVSIIGATTQFLILFIGGFLLANLFFDKTISFLLAIMLAFGSTMVVIDALTRKGELLTLHGRIALGTLLMQDIIAIAVIALIGGVIDVSSSWNIFVSIMLTIIKLAILILITVASAKLLPIIFRFAAKSQELLFLCSLSVAFLFSFFSESVGRFIIGFLAIFNIQLSEYATSLIEPGFSIVIGAFLGGVSLGSLIYKTEISSKIQPLKEFFAIIFFVSLGLNVQLTSIASIWVPLVVFLLFLLLVKPLVLSGVVALFGYERRTSFLTGLTLFQVSEFALIILAVGVTQGIFGNEIFSLVTLLAAITMMLTSSVFDNRSTLYEKNWEENSILENSNKRQQKVRISSRKCPQRSYFDWIQRNGIQYFQDHQKIKEKIPYLRL